MLCKHLTKIFTKENLPFYRQSFPSLVNTLFRIRDAKIQFDFEKFACECDFEQDFFQWAANFPQIPLFLHIFADTGHGFFSAPSF
jgi:hypothetical protein